MPSPLLPPPELLRRLFDAAVRRAQPSHAMPPHLPPPPAGRTVVLGAGKAGGAMADAVDASWPADAPLSGLVVTRYGHVPPAYATRLAEGKARIDVVEAAHPVPDEAGLRAAQRIMAFANDLGPDDLVLCLVSGGGSALLAAPAEGMDFATKQAVNHALLRSGASIGEMNCVRKHLSAVKGGRLAARCGRATVVTLLISDVPGDDPAVIASGPTVPDPTTCADALAILDRYRISLPQPLRQALADGRLETPKPGDPVFSGNRVVLVATPEQALEAAAEEARQLGLNAYILSDRMEGESREVGKVHAALARHVARCGQPFTAPCVILSGGETTVTVRQAGGHGGRATEFLLGAAIALEGTAGVHVLAADTDGIDGIDDNAGAIVTPDTLARARARGLDAQRHLDANDARSFFAGIGDLVVTGPTYTNVNDFRAMLVGVGA
jgi:hydroxypyruvate reductase